MLTILLRILFICGLFGGEVPPLPPAIAPLLHNILLFVEKFSDSRQDVVSNI